MMFGSGWRLSLLLTSHKRNKRGGLTVAGLAYGNQVIQDRAKRIYGGARQYNWRDIKQDRDATSARDQCHGYAGGKREPEHGSTNYL